MPTQQKYTSIDNLTRKEGVIPQAPHPAFQPDGDGAAEKRRKTPVLTGCYSQTRVSHDEKQGGITPLKMPSSPRKDYNPKGPIKVVLRFDGSAAPNPGAGGGGAIGTITFAMTDGTSTQESLELNQPYGHSTSNSAEYLGLIGGMRAVLRHLQSRGLRAALAQVLAVGDSELVIRQMEGKYETNAPALLVLRDIVQGLVARFRSVTFRACSRSVNSTADALANDGRPCQRRTPEHQPRSPGCLLPVAHHFRGRMGRWGPNAGVARHGYVWERLGVLYRRHLFADDLGLRFAGTQGPSRPVSPVAASKQDGNDDPWHYRS